MNLDLNRMPIRQSTDVTHSQLKGKAISMVKGSPYSSANQPFIPDQRFQQEQGSRMSKGSRNSRGGMD